MCDDKDKVGLAAVSARSGLTSAAVFGLLLAAGLFSSAAMAQAPGSETRADLASARQDIQGFEGLINKLLGEQIKNSFVSVQKSKGAYLQGYGVMFSFVVNIHRATIQSPFGPVARADPDTPEEKKRQIEELKDRLVKLLQSNADRLRQLRKDEYVSIVMFVEDRNFPDEENQNKTVVLSVLKRDADELARREDRSREFKQRMRIVEY